MSENVKVDPITLEIIRGALQSCAREMDAVIERTAMSAFIREKKDYFSGITDRDARMLFTMHDRAGPGMIEAIFEQYPIDTMRPGDVYWLNDCYQTKGAISHSPDMCFAVPVFVEGGIVAFSLCFGHYWDIGGARPGTLSPSNTDVFQEGIVVPPVRIIDQGKLNADLYKTVMRNSRFPDLFEGDTRAMMAASKLGQARLLELFDRFGKSTVEQAFAELLERSERAVVQSISRRIRPGRYTFSDWVDNDCVSDKPVRIQLDAEFTKDGVTLIDCTSSDDQVRGPINALLHPDIARMVFSSVLAWQDDSVMQNEGAWRPVGGVRLRSGSIFQPVRPAALGLRAHVMYRFVNSVLGLVAQASDGQTPAGSSDNVILMFRSLDATTGKYFLCTDGLGSGQGARPFADGTDAVYPLRGQKNHPIEFMEIEFPLRIERYAVHEDSGGPGCYRGGTGVLRDFRVLAEEVTVATRMNGLKFQMCWGVKGGLAGRSGGFVVNPGLPTERKVPGFADEIKLRRDDVLRAITTGGGGYGDALDRDLRAVQADVLDGYVSVDGARADYGVVLISESLDIDLAATERERATQRTQRAELPLFDRGKGFAELEKGRV